jgi:hypothetical protein
MYKMSEIIDGMMGLNLHGSDEWRRGFRQMALGIGNGLAWR